MRRGAVIAVGLAGLASGCAGFARRDAAPPTPARMAQIQAVSHAAQEAFDRQDYARAQSELERLVAETPRSPEAHHRLGRVFLAQNHPAAAAACFRQALSLDRDYVDAIIGLGQVALDSGRLQEGLRRFDEAIELEPDRAEAHFARGRALESLGRPDDAQAAYFRAIESDSALAPAVLRIAALQLEEGRFDQSLVRLDQVIELTPGDPEARLLRGRAHLALRHPGPAVADLQFAAEKLPDRADVFYQLALALDASQKSSDARQAADRAATLAPGWAEALELSQKLRR